MRERPCGSMRRENGSKWPERKDIYGVAGTLNPPRRLVVSAEPASVVATSPQASYSLRDFAMNWGAMLLLIGVWVFLIASSRIKKSPQGRTLAPFEQQNAIFAEQSQLLARLATAAQAKGSHQG